MRCQSLSPTAPKSRRPCKLCTTLCARMIGGATPRSPRQPSICATPCSVRTRSSARAVHAHVQRSVAHVGEAAPGFIDLHARHAEVPEAAIDLRNALLGEDVGDSLHRACPTEHSPTSQNEDGSANVVGQI